MPSKSEKFSSRSWVDFFSRGAALCGVAGGLLLSFEAHATLTVTPVKSDGTVLSNVSSTTAYYPSLYPAASSNVLDSGDSSVSSQIDTTAGYGSAASSGLIFNVSSDLTTLPTDTSKKTLLVVGVSTGSGIRTVPFGSFKPGSGSLANCSSGYCDFQESTNYFYSVPYVQGTTVTVGIFPNDICLRLNSTATSTGVGSSNLSGGACSSGAVVTPTSTVATIFPLTFYLISYTSSATFTSGSFNPSSTSDATTLDSKTLNVNLQTLGTPTASCLSSQSGAYIPGDGQILLNTANNFGLSGTGSGYAPSGLLIVLYRSTSGAHADSAPPYTNGTPAPTDTPTSSIWPNQVLSRVAIGSDRQPVLGFTNSNPTTDTYYNLRFMVRDLAGYVYANSGSASCQLNDVRTADVRGFLKESKCFIATAAFRSMDAAPVMLLRQFRDEVLLQTRTGASFVQWYYRWSPPAAEWLIDHPDFRYPVLLALIPLEIIAWFCLRPLLLLCFVAAGLALLLMVRDRGNRETKGQVS